MWGVSMNISDQVLERIVKLASKGYDVRFTWYYSDTIQIRVTKNYLNAAQVLSLEEIKQSKFDVVLYAINRLVQVVDGCV